MQQGSNSTSTSTLTDEQILDMELTPGGDVVPARDAAAGGATRNQSARNESGVILSGAKDLSGGVGALEAGEILRRSAPQNDSNSDIALLDDATGVATADVAASATVTDRAQATTAADPARAAMKNENDPAWLTALEAQPQGREAAAEARAWRAAATDVASLDAAYFSADAGKRSGLATRLYDSDPAAFRAMLAESARMLSLRDPQGLAELARELGAASQSATNQSGMPLIAAGPRTLLNAINGNSRSPLARADSAASVARVARQGSLETELPMEAARDPRLFRPTNVENASGLPNSGRPELQTANDTSVFPAEAYRSFEASTNEDVARRVHRAIDHTLSTTLPEGVAEGARRRIAEDIFQEVHASLASDRDLARRLGASLRDWRFDAAARQQVSSLLTGRARAVLPEVARRVVAEWTSSVLASDRAKTARIDAAVSRRDITGGRLPEPVPASSLRPRDLDYRRLSDEQIMEL